ncbi:hypothetical protein CL629_01630 [bacterium]|nr:hypothetical protein [bacterium]|tara:strand:+ start:2257 stop:2742 length:486 start_codon:yes stop_codon:yes gene_type:complete
MAFNNDLLTVLFRNTMSYKLLREFAHKRRQKEVKDSVLRTTLYRLRKQGLVVQKDGKWSITNLGKDFLKRKEKAKIWEHGLYDKSLRERDKNMIIAFDIPESERRKRDWLRVELRLLGFDPIQKSVWFGPYPLPREFIQSLGKLELITYLKFFRARKDEVV